VYGYKEAAMRALTTPLAILLISVPLSVLQGQKPHRLGPPDKVRVYQRGIQQDLRSRHVPDAVGTILTLTADSLLLLADDGATIILPVNSIVSIDINRGLRSNWLKGMTAGAVIGSGAGLAIGLATRFGTEGCYTGLPLEPTAQCQDTWISVLGTVGIGAAGGALLGAVIGMLIKTDRWERIAVDGQSVRLIAGRGQLGFSAAVAF
jgi:hypothetical protein